MALKSKWKQMCQRSFRTSAVGCLWNGAYALSLPDMVAVVMGVAGRWNGG